MAILKRPVVHAPPVDNDAFCTRTDYLEGKDEDRAMMRDMKKCRRVRSRPGYETLTKMKYNK